MSTMEYVKHIIETFKIRLRAGGVGWNTIRIV